MSTCPTCGHQLGAGRFCTGCGSPVDPSAAPSVAPAGDWRTDTAERKLPRVTAPGDPRTPPSALSAPPPPRYPLYADQVAGQAADGSLVTHGEPDALHEPDGPVGVVEPVASEAYDDPDPSWPEPPLWEASEPEPPVAYAEAYAVDDYEDDERRSPWPWLLVALLVLGLLAAAWWFVVRDTGSANARDRSGGDTSASPGASAAEVAPNASAEVPRTAPPNVDVDGARVAYDASNMLDGVPETTWRAGGDATGTAIRLTLREPTELHSVGLINGYAKVSTDDQGRTFDWYLGNRRVTDVVWVLPGGQRVRQSLTEDRALQMVDVDPVTTDKVVLRIAGVSPPGDGTASRNFTAISEVSLVGVPQG